MATLELTIELRPLPGIPLLLKAAAAGAEHLILGPDEWAALEAWHVPFLDSLKHRWTGNPEATLATTAPDRLVFAGLKLTGRELSMLAAMAASDSDEVRHCLDFLPLGSDNASVAEADPVTGAVDEALAAGALASVASPAAEPLSDRPLPSRSGQAREAAQGSEQAEQLPPVLFSIDPRSEPTLFVEGRSFEPHELPRQSQARSPDCRPGVDPTPSSAVPSVGVGPSTVVDGAGGPLAPGACPTGAAHG